MNYRHAFHAGNHADVLKHMALVFCLDALKRKPAPFAVLDTHAGVARYDLTSEEATRSPEWKEAIERLWGWQAPPPAVSAYLDAVRSFNQGDALRVYPGSPALILGALREGDLFIGVEKHPEDFATLKRKTASDPRAQLHQRDAWEALGALLPPPRPRGLVLIDPPYEEPGELERAAIALGGAVKRFRHGLFLWWRPLKSESALAAADAELGAQILAAGPLDTLRVDLWVDQPRPEGRLTGSSLLLINPPFGLEPALREALPALSARLATGQAGWRLTP